MLEILGRRISLGMTWDDALPLISQGERLSLVREDKDTWTDERKFQDGLHIFFTFKRLKNTPYRLVDYQLEAKS